LQEQLAPRFIWGGVVFEPLAFQFSVLAHPARHLPCAGSCYPAGNLGAALGRRG
jgi:hypothetical protein